MDEDDRTALRNLKHRRTMRNLYIIAWVLVGSIAICLIYIILVLLGVL